MLSEKLSMLAIFYMVVHLLCLGQSAKTPIHSSRPTVSCSRQWPKPAGIVKLTAPQAVDTSFDCRNRIYEHSGGHVFELTKGASLSNCFFQQKGVDDSVHVEGDGHFTLTNLYFLTTGDDGISIKGNGDVTVVGGGFLQAENKALQHDGTGSVVLRGGCYENVHILAKSCGNCVVNSAVRGRTLKVENCVISNVKTVCGVNTNKDDRCIVTNLKGTPTESVCTGYNGISNPNNLPKQTSKNIRNAHCVF